MKAAMKAKQTAASGGRLGLGGIPIAQAAAPRPAPLRVDEQGREVDAQGNIIEKPKPQIFKVGGFNHCHLWTSCCWKYTSTPFTLMVLCHAFRSIVTRLAEKSHMGINCLKEISSAYKDSTIQEGIILLARPEHT